ncbi:MAG: lytic transglycosylase domain-containing protein [Myxococcales bacterium]|nr:lytic transglycosylase domain-containing protein [Myxococcales bacterium]
MPLKPKGLSSFSVDLILSSMGPERPVSVDRALALHAAGFAREVDDEVRAAFSFWSAPTSTRELMLRVDWAELVDSGHRAFQHVIRNLPSSRDVMKGDYWAWRAYRAAYPRAYVEAVGTATRAHDIQGPLVWSIMRTESHYRDDALSPAGARGLMQIMPSTARRIGETAPEAQSHAIRYVEPRSNVWLGAWYLRRLSERFPTFLPASIGAYNAGPRAMIRWVEASTGRPTDEFIERIPYRETRRYVRRVLESLWTYQMLYDLPMTDLAGTVPPPGDGGVGF